MTMEKDAKVQLGSLQPSNKIEGFGDAGTTADGEIITALSNGAVLSELERERTVEGAAYFHRLGWKRLTIVLIVETIALGSLSLPAAFASLGLVAGNVLCVSFGLLAMYASYIVGEAKLRYPAIEHYTDIGRMLFGNIGYWGFTVAFSLQLTLVVGSHCLTGAIAFVQITRSGVCFLVFSIVSAIILLLLAIPPSFADIAILGYIDFASIIAAIGITMIATGVQSRDVASFTWSAWPKEGLTLPEALVAICNIVFAYAFAAGQPSFMDEMHNPSDYKKAIFSLSVLEILIYTLTGSLIFVFVGNDVQSPALLSAGSLVSRVAFGIALPVIFISGSINTTIVARFLHGKMYKGSVVRFVNTPKGWATWLAVISAITLIAWVIAEAIPFFSELLSISAALFVSGFSYYIPPLLWFKFLKEGPWYSRHNIITGLLNASVFSIGIAVLGLGLYSSISQVNSKFANGSVNRPFSCSVSY